MTAALGDHLPAPTLLYGDALVAAAAGQDASSVRVRTEEGRTLPLDVGRWTSTEVPGDRSVLDRCGGPVLDVGCGPGRLTSALAARGVAVLGIDVAPQAVRLARTRTDPARVLHRDVFDRVPGAGRWAQVLVLDGNVGIGGDLDVLMARCAQLLAPSGTALVEVGAPGTGSRTELLRLEADDGRCSRWFRWAVADAAALLPAAGRAGLREEVTWHACGRHFLALAAPAVAPDQTAQVHGGSEEAG